MVEVGALLDELGIAYELSPQGSAVVVLPGFPTSAIFTFHEFVAPVIRMLAGRHPSRTLIVSPAINSSLPAMSAPTR